VNAELIQPHTKFVDLGMDSLDVVVLIGMIEQEFNAGLMYPDEDLESVDTVQDLIDLVQSKSSR
jgi:acyl carrier protein